MSKEKLIAIDDLPKPGEPLKVDIAEQNRAVIEENLKDRLQRLSGRMSRRDLFFVGRRYKHLWRKLNKAGYNELVSRRFEIKQEIVKLAERHKALPAGKRRDAIRANGLELAAAGRELHDRITALQPFADEFDELARRLRGHEIAVAYEIEDRQNAAALQTEARTWESLLYAAFKQNSRVHHRGVDRKGREFRDVPTIESIDVTDDRVFYKIKLTSQNMLQRMFGRYSSALPYDVDVKDLTDPETLDNLSAACGRIVTVERGKRDTNLYYVVSRLDSPDGIPTKVLYSKVIQWYPLKDHPKTPWMAGVTRDRKAESYNFEDNPHVLIAGSTQSGKSNQLNGMIATLVTMNTPDEVRILLIDNKGGVEFTHWQGIRHELRPMIKKASEVLPALKWLREIMERRLAALEHIKAKNLLAYNAKVKDGDKWPRIICYIDEMATLLGLGDTTAEIQSELRVLVSQGRAVGVHLVICTQHVSVDVLPGWIKTNMTLRVSGKMPSDSASRVILDTATAVNIPSIPGRMVFSIGRSELIAQSPFISDDEIASAVAKSKADPEPDNSEFTAAAPIVPREKFSREDMLTLALSEFDGKLSVKPMHDRLGNEIISRRQLETMVSEVISLGDYIDHCGERYQLKKVGRGRVMVRIPHDKPQDLIDPLDTELRDIVETTI